MKFQNADMLNLLRNTALQLKNYFFSIEQQPLFPLPEKTSQIARISFLSYLIEFHDQQSTTDKAFLICDPNTDMYSSFIYNTLIHPLLDTIIEFLSGVYNEIHIID